MSDTKSSPQAHVLVLIPFYIPPSVIPTLQSHHPNLHITRVPPAALNDLTNDPSPFATATHLITFSILPPSLQHCPKLKLIHFISAGIDSYASHPLLSSPEAVHIRVTVSNGVHGPAIAEWFTMTLLNQSRQWVQLRQWHTEKHWPPVSVTGEFLKERDLVGQRIGVLGYGSIGRQIARVASAMGMVVVAYTATPRRTPEERRDRNYVAPGLGDPEGLIPERWYSEAGSPGNEGLHEFLRQRLDVLVVSTPLTKETRGLLGKREFEVLAEHSPEGGVFFSNVGRGEVVVQDELVQALKERRGVRAAALDVVMPEPPSKESELWDLPNCVTTPHISSLSTGYMKRTFDLFSINLSKAENERLLNQWDGRRGY